MELGKTKPLSITLTFPSSFPLLGFAFLSLFTLPCGGLIIYTLNCRRVVNFSLFLLFVPSWICLDEPFRGDFLP